MQLQPSSPYVSAAILALAAIPAFVARPSLARALLRGALGFTAILWTLSYLVTEQALWIAGAVSLGSGYLWFFRPPPVPAPDEE